MSQISALLVDDDKNIRHALHLCLDSLQARVYEAASADTALDTARRIPLDVVFLDLALGAEDGMGLIEPLLAERPGVLIVIVTAFATVPTAVEAIRRGAWEYLAKPYTPAQVRQLMTSVASHHSLAPRRPTVEEGEREARSVVELSTRAPAMRACLTHLHRAAEADSPVLLRGESGTGKGVCAETLHLASRRRLRPFVTVGCAHLDPAVLASELFGHARGALAGAVRDQPGRLELADGGTLFLEEVSELPFEVQGHLCRFLEEGHFTRVGEGRPRRVDVRVVAATHRDDAATGAGPTVRNDLLFRLNSIELHVPPLRQRREDIIPLAHGFLDLFAGRLGRRPPTLSKAAESRLLTYSWPGNVRELRNTIEHVMTMWPATVVAAEALPERMLGLPQWGALAVGGPYSLDQLERAHIEAILARSETLEDAAATLGIDASTLWRKRKRFGAGEPDRTQARRNGGGADDPHVAERPTPER